MQTVGQGPVWTVITNLTKETKVSGSAFVVQLEELIGHSCSHSEIMALASKVVITYSMEICQNPYCIS